MSTGNQTPDRFGGVREEEGILFTDEGINPSAVGECRLVGGVFKMKDGAKTFDPSLGEPIAKGIVFPGSPDDNDLFFRTDLRLLFYYDASRSKWLTTRRAYFNGYRNLVSGSGLVYFGGMNSTNGPRMPHAGTLTAFTIKNNNIVTRTLRLYKYDGTTTTLIGSLSLISENAKSTITANVDFDADDCLILAMDFTAGSGALSDAFVTFEVSWRATT